MSKLTLDALKSKAEAVASNELLATISGGLENACHDDTPEPDYTNYTYPRPMFPIRN